jgi:pyrimidine deaminase RibD-like protein
MQYRRCTLILAVALAPAAHADCPFVEHTVTGTVVANDQPVAGATVEAEWVEKKAGIASTRAKTDEVGRYVLTITFDPYSSRSFGGKEACEGKLEEVIVRVRAAGRDPYEKRVAITEQAEDVNLALR